jgi:hypothetical protein
MAGPAHKPALSFCVDYANAKGKWMPEALPEPIQNKYFPLL